MVPMAKSASTGGGLSEFSLRMTAKNFPHVLCKNVPGALLWKILPMVVAGQVFIITEALIGRRPKLRKNLASYWRGLGLALRELPLMLKKRREIQAKRRISASDFYALIRRAEMQKRTYRA